MTEEVLLLDDDLTTLTFLERVLSDAGFKCSVSGDPQQALATVAAREEIAVVVSDLYMPHMSGLEFADALTTLGLNRPVPRVLLLTARPSLESAVGALRSGAHDFLVKPIRPAEIIDTVSRALERARQDRRAFMTSALDTIEQLRRVRDRYNGHKLDEVAWELLLELLRAEQGNQKLSVSALSISIPGVSATTSLRRIGELATGGYVDRTPDARDGRRDFVTLTVKARALLTDYLANVDSCLTDLLSNDTPVPTAARSSG